MSAKHLIDAIRNAAKYEGVNVNPMTAARNFVANLCFGRDYSPLMAAENHQKFTSPHLDPSRTESLVRKQPNFEGIARFCTDNLDAFLGDYELPVMTVTEAVLRGIVPEPPLVTLSQVEAKMREAERDGLELIWVPFTPSSLRKGKHLRFIREGVGDWHALTDSLYPDGIALKTLELNNCVFRYVSTGDGDDLHLFLCHQFCDGRWTLERAVHLLVDDDEFDLSINDLLRGF